MVNRCHAHVHVHTCIYCRLVHSNTLFYLLLTWNGLYSLSCIASRPYSVNSWNKRVYIHSATPQNLQIDCCKTIIYAVPLPVDAVNHFPVSFETSCTLVLKWSSYWEQISLHNLSLSTDYQMLLVCPTTKLLPKKKSHHSMQGMIAYTGLHIFKYSKRNIT